MARIQGPYPTQLFDEEEIAPEDVSEKSGMMVFASHRAGEAEAFAEELQKGLVFQEYSRFESNQTVLVTFTSPASTGSEPTSRQLCPVRSNPAIAGKPR